jgi:hypothetical protein
MTEDLKLPIDLPRGYQIRHIFWRDNPETVLTEREEDEDKEEE